MKRILIALLLGITLVSCGAKREVDCISVTERSLGDYYFDECGYDRDEVIGLIKKDIEKADNMYLDYSNLIKTDNYIIIYGVEEVIDNNYEVFIYNIEYGDKEYIDYMYEAAKDSYEKHIK